MHIYEKKRQQSFEKFCTQVIVGPMSIIGDQDIVKSLIKYHLYDETPRSERRDSTLRFETPMNIIDALTEFEDLEKDHNAKYVYDILTAKLTSKQEEEFDKYHYHCVNTTDDMPETYPLYALQQVFVKEWKPSDMCSSSVKDLKFTIRDLYRDLGNTKLTYRRNKSRQYVHNDFWHTRGVSSYNENIWWSEPILTGPKKKTENKRIIWDALDIMQDTDDYQPTLAQNFM